MDDLFSIHDPLAVHRVFGLQVREPDRLLWAAGFQRADYPGLEGALL